MEDDDSYDLIILVAVFFIILTIYKLFSGNKSEDKQLDNGEEIALADAIPSEFKVSKEQDVVEVELVADQTEVQLTDVISASVYTYNNLFPGPVIEAKVGQKLVINFTNNLLVPTGLKFCGYPVSGHIQKLSLKPILPESSTRFAFKLIQPGIYIYRSNIQQVEQVSNGLYGALLVHDHIQNGRVSMPKEYNVLALSDIWVDNVVNKQHLYLVNGIVDGTIEIEKNVAQRIYIVNSSINTVFRLSLSEHDMLKVGGDQGLSSKPSLIPANSIITISPGERLDLVFNPKSDFIVLKHGDIKLVTFKCLDTGRREKLHIPTTLRQIPRIRLKGDESVIKLKYNKVGDLYSCYNDIPSHYLTRDNYPQLKAGKIYLFEIINRSKKIQNFYLSGFNFQHLLTQNIKDTDVVYTPDMVENKDTLIVPPQSIVVVATKLSKYDRTIKGIWDFGSNFLWHNDRGMKAYFKVI